MMKTPDEIKKGLKCCFNEDNLAFACEECPYDAAWSGCGDLFGDALAYIQQLEAKVPRWISVEERLPEKQKSVLVSAKDKTFGYQRIIKAAHIGHHECSTEDYEWQDYEGDTEYDEEKDCFWIPACWYETNSIEDKTNWIIDCDYEITHWMPLPEPPEV